MAKSHSVKTKTVWLVIISIIVIGFAILVYFKQQGKLKIGADVATTPETTNASMLAPVYRMISNTTGQHFYTMDSDEMQKAQRQDNLTTEGIAWYGQKVVSDACPIAGMQVIYRQWNPTNLDHFYTMNKEEADRSIAQNGYTDEHYLGCAFPPGQPAPAGTMPIYRAWKPNNHFYTASKTEFDKAVSKDGYTDEQILGYSYVDTIDAIAPVYRMISNSTGQHFYTMDTDEMQKAQRQDDLTTEGIAWYGQKVVSDACPIAGMQVIYRQWNPTNLDHFYTMNKEEADRSIAQNGYVDEHYLGCAFPREEAMPADAASIYRGWQQYDHFYTVSKTEFDKAVQNGLTDEQILGYAYEAMLVEFFTPVAPTPNPTISPTITPTPTATITELSAETVTKLVSTGSSLWVNIVIALLAVAGIGYWMFRREIWEKK